MAYIDVNKLLKDLTTTPDGTKLPNVDCDNVPIRIDLRLLKRIILRQPTKDIEKVIRCKNCKHKDGIYCDHPENITHSYDSDENSYDHYIMVSPDHFCSYGEERES